MLRSDHSVLAHNHRTPRGRAAALRPNFFTESNDRHSNEKPGSHTDCDSTEFREGGARFRSIGAYPDPFSRLAEVSRYWWYSTSSLITARAGSRLSFTGWRLESRMLNQVSHDESIADSIFGHGSHV